MSLLDTLLDQDLSEIADLPTFEIPPKGFYRLLVSKVEEKTVDLSGGKGKAPVIQFDYQVVEPLELEDESERELVKVGQNFSESYFFHNDPEKTKQAIKTTFKAVGESLGCKTLKELVEKLQGCEIAATVNHRKDKNDSEKIYAQIRNAQIL